MQLNITTDYAIRTVLFLAIKKDVVSSSEISAAMKIPQNYILVLTKRLREAGIIDTIRGSNGGFVLKKEPWDISIHDIIQAMEGTTKINRCLEEDHSCSRHAIDTCPVRKNYEKFQTIFDDYMNGITIESLM